jgi:hypothetical protein
MGAWTERAEKIGNEYIRGNAWQNSLRRHLELNFPALVKELGEELDDYCIVTTADAIHLYNDLLDDGVDGETASELAMARLLLVPGGDVEDEEDDDTSDTEEMELAIQELLTDA